MDPENASPISRRFDARDLHRLDGKLANALTGLGIPGVDQAESTYREPLHYSSAMARQEYRGSWAARREIDRPAKDMVRAGVRLEDLPAWVDQKAVLSYMSDIGRSELPEDCGALPALSRLYAEANKLGGAALVIIADDGLPPALPIDLDRLRSIVDVVLVERDEILPLRTTSSMEPEHYIIGTARTKLTAASVVHRSRVIISKGARLSPSEEWTNQGWGASVLESLHYERTSMHAAVQEAASLLLKLNTDVVYFSELNELLCTQSAMVDERIGLIAKARSQHKLIPLDAGRAGTADKPGRNADNFTNVTRPPSGVKDLGAFIAEQWAAGTGQTPSIALGKTPGGLNSGENAGDWQSWTSYIEGEQVSWLIPRWDYLLLLAFAAKDGPTQGKVPETWTTVCNSLWKPTDLEREQIRSTRAGADNTYVAMGAITAEQVSRQRFVKGSTGELVIDPLLPGVAAQGVAAASSDTPTDAAVGIDRELLDVLMSMALDVQRGALDIETALRLIGATAKGVDMSLVREVLQASTPAQAAAAASDIPQQETDEIEQALSAAEIPNDLRSSRELAVYLSERFGRAVTAHKITALSRAGRLREWPLLGKPSYSQSQALRVVAEDLGLVDAPEPAPRAGEVVSPVSDYLHQLGPDAWEVLSESGDVLATFEGPDAEAQARERLREIEAAKAAQQ